MSGWITSKQALRVDPLFFEKRGPNAWKFDPSQNGIYSRFGFGEIRVQLKRSAWGKKLEELTPEDLEFDRMVSGEAPNLNVPIYYLDPVTGIWMVGILSQDRPFADIAYGVPAESPISFAQPVMGFLDKLLDPHTLKVYESAKAGAVREALEEAGIRGYLDIEDLGDHWGNPTGPLVTPTRIIALRVDPTKVDGDHSNAEELIKRCTFVPALEFFRRVGIGKYDGDNYRGSVPGFAIMVLLARHPEMLGLSY